MEYGKNIKFFISLREKGKPNPLDDRLESDIVIDWFFWAFGALNKSRQTGFGLSPLSMSDIISFSSGVELICTPEFFIDVVQAMDDVFLDHNSKKQQTNKKVEKSKGKWKNK